MTSKMSTGSPPSPPRRGRGGRGPGPARRLLAAARLGDRRPGLVAQLVEVGQLVDLPEVAEIEEAVDGVDLALLDVERAHELLAQRLVHPRVDLEPHDLAEAA